MFLVLKQKNPGDYSPAEMNDHGDVTHYATRLEAERRAAELGGVNAGYSAEDDEDSVALCTYGQRWKIQHS